MSAEELPPTSSSQVEIGKLHKNLEEVRHKLIGLWTSDLEKHQEQTKQAHNEQMKSGKDNINQANDNLLYLLDQANANKKVLEERNEEVKSMKSSAENTVKETQEILLQKEHAEEQLRIMSKEIETNMELLIAQEKSTHTRLQELRKATTFYNQRLGVSLKKIDGDLLQVAFTQINPNKIDEVYFFVVKVNSAQKYEVTDCQPAISNMEDLVKNLNETNKFSEFLIIVRKAFKSMVYK
ncbi:kinetochore protein Spc25-like [Antedon mediterranea]|uniref:kinetochore protein Spc25-like n=1 Tax=Antedon mediterranea TaxID=105859 RepID=UPI003AF8D2D1